MVPSSECKWAGWASCHSWPTSLQSSQQDVKLTYKAIVTLSEKPCSISFAFQSRNKKCGLFVFVGFFFLFFFCFVLFCFFGFGFPCLPFSLSPPLSLCLSHRLLCFSSLTLNFSVHSGPPPPSPIPLVPPWSPFRYAKPILGRVHLTRTKQKAH